MQIAKAKIRKLVIYRRYNRQMSIGRLVGCLHRKKSSNLYTTFRALPRSGFIIKRDKRQAKNAENNIRNKVDWLFSPPSIEGLNFESRRRQKCVTIELTAHGDQIAGFEIRKKEKSWLRQKTSERVSATKSSFREKQRNFLFLLRSLNSLDLSRRVAKAVIAIGGKLFRQLLRNTSLGN